MQGEQFVFDATEAVTVIVPSAPAFDKHQDYFDLAVPTLAANDLVLKLPAMIVARVTARPAAGRSRAAGPIDRAKAIMDALHDQRRKPHYYADAGKAAPLTDDKPHFVRGLAVEVHAGSTSQVEYRLGSALTTNGEVFFQLDVDALAPNDIAGSQPHAVQIAGQRDTFVAALVSAWATTDRPDLTSAIALVVRHLPQRDEDNTWRTWLGAITGGPDWSAVHWGGEAPLANWRPHAFASICESNLPCAMRFELVAPGLEQPRAAPRRS